MTSLHIPLASQTDLAGFHSEATRLIGLQAAPASIGWSAPAAADAVSCDLAAHGGDGARTRSARAVVPLSFIRLSEAVVLHRDPGRFDLLYRALWRLVHEPALRGDHGDVDLIRLRQMAHAVRRDLQKMRAKLAFRPLLVQGRLLDFAWYQPAHHIAETVAAGLALRRGTARWLLLTPDRWLQWEAGRLLSAAPLQAGDTPEPGAGDAVWTRVLGRRA